MFNRLYPFRKFVIISAALCVLYGIIFQPVRDGDSGAYFQLAKQIYNLPQASTADLSHRSPLYSLILGSFIILFGEDGYEGPVHYLQLFFLFGTALMTYKIFALISHSPIVSFWAGLATLLNLSAIYFSYLLISETTSLFLLILLVWLFLKFLKTHSMKWLFFSGLTSGLVVLARFNMIGIPLVLGLMVILDSTVWNKKKVLVGLKRLGMVSLSTLFILQFWSYYNLLRNDYYGVIPLMHKKQRWAIPSVIDENTNISEEYHDILRIFLDAREKVLVTSVKETERNASMLSFTPIKKIADYLQPGVNGFFVYNTAKTPLLEYYRLADTPSNIIKLGELLLPFYNEVASEKKWELWRLRFYSLFNSLRYVSPLLDELRWEKTNLNKLPSISIFAYKISFLLIVIFVFLSIPIILVNLKPNPIEKNNLRLLFLIAIVSYFPLVNFYANVMNDANRFKFPSEPLIIGLFFLFLIDGKGLFSFIRNNKQHEINTVSCKMQNQTDHI